MGPNILKLVGIMELESLEVGVDSMIFIDLGHLNQGFGAFRVHPS